MKPYTAKTSMGSPPVGGNLKVKYRELDGGEGDKFFFCEEGLNRPMFRTETKIPNNDIDRVIADGRNSGISQPFRKGTFE
jgi:hypothetical protein